MLSKMTSLMNVGKKERLALLLLTLPLLAPQASSALCTSVASGAWNNPATWSCTPGPIPIAADNVTIVAPHNVNITASIVQLTSLTVQNGATLTISGFPVQLAANIVDVNLGGTIQGVGGAQVYITAPTGGTLALTNDGTISGGNVFVHDGGPGGDLACPSGSTITANGGSFLGDPVNGNVYLLAENILLNGATVNGGSGFVPTSLFGNSIAGSIYITGVQVSIVGGSSVISGSNTNPVGIGGSVKIIAETCSGGPTPNLDIPAGNTIALGTPSSGGCPGAIAFSSGTSSIGATIPAGPAGCIYWDPPDLVLEADAELTGGTIILAGDSLDATDLANRTLGTPAIDAVDTIEIRINPGGTLDLSGLPNTPFFVAGKKIVLCVDEEGIKTGRKTRLHKIMKPAPELCRAQETFALSINPGSDQRARPGSTVSYPVNITNISSVPAELEIFIGDAEGWIVGGSTTTSVILDPGESFLRTLQIAVPAGAEPGQVDVIKVYAEIPGTVAETSGGTVIVSE